MEARDGERQDGWMPPFEARPMAAAKVRARMSPLVVALIVAAAGVVALLVAGTLIGAVRGEDPGTVEGVVHEFVDARANGDAAGACALLSERARRDMVALVRGVDPPQASAADCERYVLAPSEASQFTDPALPAFTGRDVAVKHFPGDYGLNYATVEPEGLDDPFLELRKVRGEWRLDGLAAERVSFVAGCVDRAGPRRYCECVFDALAERGRASSDDLTTMLRGAQNGGGVPPFVQEAVAGCENA